MTGLLLVLSLLTTSPVPGRTPAAAGAPRFVQLTSVEGLPPDSNMQGEFMDAFRGTFAEERLAGEQRGPEETWRPIPDVPNRFKLLEGFPADDAWTLQVVIGAPAPAGEAPKAHPRPGDTRRRVSVARRASRGMVLVVTALSPEAIRGGVRAMPARLAFAFPAPPVLGEGTQPVTSAGYAYSWAAAGRAAGVLALETLHHYSGDLSETERFVIAPALRVGAGAEAPK